MSLSIKDLLCVVVATGALAGCGGKPADAPSAGAAPASGTAQAAGYYHGVPVYPGMNELMTHDLPAAPGLTLHSGSYSSTDKPEQIRAYYREQLGKLFSASGELTDQGQGEGMYRLVAGSGDKQVIILVHPGDSGQQIVGIQVSSKD